MEQKILSLKDDKINSEVEIFEYPEELSGGRNLALNSNFNTTDAGSINTAYNYTYSDINGVRRYEATGKNGTMVRYFEFKIPGIDVGAYTMTIRCRPENRPVNLIATSSTANGLTRTSIPITDDFVKYTIHFNKIVDSNTPLRLLFYQHRESTTSDELAGVLWIDWYKIEKGNKATDWTPAPEDLGLSYPDFITEFKPSISDRYILTEELVEYPEELNGGRNLLRSFENKNWNNLTGSDVIVVSPYEIIRKRPYKSHYSETFVYIKGGDTFTFSGTIGGLLTIYEYNSEGVRIGSVVAYKNIQKITFTTRPETAYLNIILSVYNLPEGEYSFSNVKLEHSNKPTPWTPAPEDLGLSYSDHIQSFGTSFSDKSILINEFIEQ